MKLMEINDENLELIETQVKNTFNYGREMQIIHEILNKFPNNNDLSEIAIKITIIDMTNSTHLSQYKSKISLYDLANFILNIPNFDKRVALGDPTLVNEIAKNTGKINLFSFASKYCTYHNTEIYHRDDYSIYDGIVVKMLPLYQKEVTKYKLNIWRRNYDYESFNKCVGDLLEKYKITIPNKRRKFDYFLWYPNR